MNKNRMWVIGAVLAIVVVIAAGWFIGISPQLTSASSANNERTSVMAANARNEILLAKLKRDYQNIDALKNQVATLQESVPTSADISSLVTELNTLANVRKVTLKSITVSDAKPYTPAIQAVRKGDTSAAQTNPKITSTNFVTIPVQIGITGDYGKVLDFVNDIQQGRRLFLVSAFSSMGSTNAKGVKGSPTITGGAQRVDSSITGFIYVLLN